MSTAASGAQVANRRGRRRRQSVLLAVLTALALALMGLSVWQGAEPAHAPPRRLMMEVGGRQQELAAATASAAAALSTAAQQQEPQPTAAPGFRHRKVVAIAAYDEYARFTSTLEALQQAWGSEQYTLLLYIDHEKPPMPVDAAGGAGAAAAAAAAREASNHQQRRVLEHALQLQAQALARPPDSPVNFREVWVNLSSTHLGRPLNKKRAAAGAMALTDFAVLLDANVALAPDGLRWFEWHVDSGFIFANPRVGTATCWSPAFPAGDEGGAGAELSPDAAAAEAAADQLVVRQLGLLDKFLLDGWAQPWGLALWRGPWEGGLELGWRGQDQQLARQLQRQGLVQSMPLVPRCNVLEGGGGGGSSSARPAGAAVVQRSLTSAAFSPASDLGRCDFAALPRNDTSAPLYHFELFATFVRYGIQPDSRLVDLTVPELTFLMEQHTQLSPAPPAQWRSSC